MLNRLDDFPIHQTVEPIAHPATTDRNAYDRFWFNGFSIDGEWMFGIAMGLYPHRGILDCAFSFVRKDGVQHSFFGSRRAPRERTDMQVGPFLLENTVPMRRTRIVLDDNESGLSCDLTFSTRTAAIEEARQTLWSGPRKIMDTTRFDLFGRWSGTIRTPEGEIHVDPDTCFGVKDRSWGVRKVGEPDTGGAPNPYGGTTFLWAPLFWDDHISQAIIYDSGDGMALHRDVLVAPLYAGEYDGPEVEDGQVRRLATCRHRLKWHPGTRLASAMEVDLVDHDGSARTITMDPILRFQMRGIGYGHPEWGHALWKGELALGHETIDHAKLDMLQMPNFHTQQLVRVSDGTQTGIGVFEQVHLGPYAPGGMTAMTDGAK
ncbi:hypothetical protein [Novosphingobium malaysiense]|uniref:AttH domain-containing protein n=1 Tax=Novosphingobium malaysiense TaxID=1348853 RepID=A0A0B1ZKJ4_9SPHN|nr:hypothetical protein [Novosphingobium malaysiense]KHK89864.1 hypothetical protein LK12_18320 [Novosphingobium malaysiense]